MRCLDLPIAVSSISLSTLTTTLWPWLESHRLCLSSPIPRCQVSHWARAYCFALWGVQLIFRVWAVSKSCSSSWIMEERKRRKSWGRKGRDHFLADLYKQLQAVHEQLTVQFQGSISKPELKRESHEKSKNQKSEKEEGHVGVVGDGEGSQVPWCFAARNLRKVAGGEVMLPP